MDLLMKGNLCHLAKLDQELKGNMGSVCFVTSIHWCRQ